MADEYRQTGVCSGNWWESAPNRFETRSPPTSSSSPSSLTQLSSMGGFGWTPAHHPQQQQHLVDDMKSTTSPVDSVSGALFGDAAPKLHGPPGSLLTDPNLQVMGLGLSSQTLDWASNQSLLGGGTVIHEEMNQPTGLSFSLSDHQPPHRFDSHGAGLHGMESPYGNNIDININTPANMLQELHQSGFDQTGSISGYHLYPENYTHQILPSSLMPSAAAGKFPPDELSPPKQHGQHHHHQLLQFSNNASYGIAPASGGETASWAPQMKASVSARFDEKPKIAAEGARDSAAKKCVGEPGMKRSRNEPPPAAAASLPGFNKARKEKMGDRITALQQLVSPFGKTDTASVLSEAIEYIKCLHQQVSNFSTACMNTTGVHPIQHHQASSEKSRDPEGPSLRSRGLCLVPLSTTLQIAHETTADFWAPTYGGAYR